jgi:hypothetical protein
MKSSHQLNWYIVESNFQLGGLLPNIPLNILGINNVYKFEMPTTLVNGEKHVLSKRSFLEYSYHLRFSNT